MNFDKLTDFAITVVRAAALAGNVDSFTKWVYVACSKLLYESRTSTYQWPMQRTENPNYLFVIQYCSYCNWLGVQ